MIKFRFVAVFWAMLWQGHSASADTVLVAPGDGTLAAAIAAAEEGDVLELITGNYTGNQISMTRSLTIRAQSASEVPRVTVPFLPSSGTGRFLFQNLRLEGSISANSCNAISFVENVIDTSSIFARCSQSNILIGNTFIDPDGTTQSFRSVSLSTAASSVFSGNTVNVPGSFTLSGATVAVGNDFAFSPQLSSSASITLSGSASIFAGNRVQIAYAPASSTISSPPEVVRLSSGGLVANNLITISDTLGAGTLDNVTGVNFVECGSGNCRIQNNVFDQSALTLQASGGQNDGAIHNGFGSATVQNNIFLDIENPVFTFDPQNSNASGNLFRNNLCDNNTPSCPDNDGNITADPRFIDTVNYRLRGNSPAVDAGAETPFLIDVDGSRADLGLYGGTFPIDQFDIQREPGRTEPWIFPAFEPSQSLDEFGNLQISVVGAARLD